MDDRDNINRLREIVTRKIDARELALMASECSEARLSVETLAASSGCPSGNAAREALELLDRFERKEAPSSSGEGGTTPSDDEDDDLIACFSSVLPESCLHVPRPVMNSGDGESRRKAKRSRASSAPLTRLATSQSASTEPPLPPPPTPAQDPTVTLPIPCVPATDSLVAAGALITVESIPMVEAFPASLPKKHRVLEATSTPLKPIPNSRNVSGYKGVYPGRQGRWQAQVDHKSIGGFATAWEAGVAVAAEIARRDFGLNATMVDHEE